MFFGRSHLLALLTTLIAAPAHASPIVAVFDLVSKNTQLNRSTLENLNDYLSTLIAREYRIIPRDDIKKTLNRQKANSYKECYSTECQIDIGKELAANMSLSSKISRIGKRCVITLKLYDLRTAASAGAAAARGGCQEDEVLESLERAVATLAKGADSLARTERPPPPTLKAPTASTKRPTPSPPPRRSQAGRGDRDAQEAAPQGL